LENEDKPAKKTENNNEYQLQEIVVKERRIKDIDKGKVVKGGATTDITEEDYRRKKR
jgi:hypothetical protein